VTRGEVVGLPVLAQDDGRQVGRVADLLCNGPTDRVIGLLLAGGTWRRRRVVPYEEVAAIGPSVVMLRRAVVLTPPDGRRLAAMRARTARIVGKRVLSGDGRDLGVLRDFEFEPPTGRITGYVVSGGVVQDLLEGQGFLPAGRAMTWADEALIVEPGSGAGGRSLGPAARPDRRGGAGAGGSPAAGSAGLADPRPGVPADRSNPAVGRAGGDAGSHVAEAAGRRSGERGGTP
jgi:uncharacterized protein YrrD